MKLTELNSSGRIYQIKNGQIVERELNSVLHTTEQFIANTNINDSSFNSTCSKNIDIAYSDYKLISLNFRGVRSKKESFLSMIEAESSHFIASTETWLNPSVYSSEIFPSDYLVFCNNRPDGYGGTVFACHKSSLYWDTCHNMYM